jgi:pimeloyl-[acyl-carrier protein] synthase
VAQQDRPVFDPIAEHAVAEMFASAQRREPPWGFYRNLRARAPIYYSRERKMWFVTGYRANEAILKSPGALLQFEKRMDAVRPTWREHPSNANVAPFIAFVDGAAHQKIRAPLMPSWTPQQMERYRPAIRASAEKTADAYRAVGGGSFADRVAFPFTQETLYHLFAFDNTKLPHARQLVNRMQIGFEIDASAEHLKDADAASVEYRTFWQREYAQRESEPPGEDMLSKLLHDGSFSTAEVALIAESLFMGGFDSTALTMTTGMWLLLQHPAEMERARAEPPAFERLPNEILRMGSAIPMTLRIAASDIEVEGFTIRRDEVIGIVLGAANRDPEVYTDPERFDLARAPSRTLAFSFGVHACLGQWLARIEIYELFRALLQRCDNIELEGEALFRDRQSVRGVEDIHLRVA